MTKMEEDVNKQSCSPKIVYVNVVDVDIYIYVVSKVLSLWSNRCKHDGKKLFY